MLQADIDGDGMISYAEFKKVGRHCTPPCLLTYLPACLPVCLDERVCAVCGVCVCVCVQMVSHIDFGEKFRLEV